MSEASTTADTANLDNEPKEAVTTSPWPAYAFHDPEFVTWWLGSLYLLQPVDQALVADVLRSAIHEPRVQEELSAFIALRTEEQIPQVEDEHPTVPKFEGTRTEQAIQVMGYQLGQQWEHNRWLLLTFLAGLTFVVGKGGWLVLKEAFRIIF